MSKNRSGPILLRGGGDLATGVALRLHRAGLRLLITELEQPLAVRRTVSFAEAVYAGEHSVEGVTARLVHRTATLVQREQLSAAWEADEIPVLIDPQAEVLTSQRFLVVVDGRLLKHAPIPLPVEVPLHIGLGPGFHAGKDCHAVIETRRSHTLGRVYWSGSTQADLGQPEGDPQRVLRAPAEGLLAARKQIGEHCEPGEVIARVSDLEILSPFPGVLRGLIHDGIQVSKGLKVGDVDPRDDPSACFLTSDKALAIGGGVLEAILTKEEIRKELF